jgi:hypothetical protein
LWRLNQYVKKHSKKEEKVASPVIHTTTSSRPKKNKPMSKTEQEAKIQELRGTLYGLDKKPGADAESGDECKFSFTPTDETC